MAGSLEEGALSNNREDQRLDSWKEIAAYFRCSVRAVQNWEKTEGLPIHRHQHRKRGTVYAYRDELESWLRLRETHEAALPRRRGSAVVVAASVISLGVMAIAGLILVALSPEAPPPILRLHSPRRITSGPGIDDYPAWSPNGEKLAYHSDARGNFDIWTIDFRSGVVTNVTGESAGHDRFPTWSPDSSTILFHSERDGGGYFVLSVDDRSVKKLRNLPIRDSSWLGGAAQWSPDGARVAWLVGGDGTQEPSIEIVRIDGTTSRRLPAPGRTQSRSDLAWSPNGRLFAYVDAHSIFSDVTSIWVIDGRTGAAHAVIERRRSDRRPSWSPDGRQLFFLSKHDGSTDLWGQPIDDEGRAVGSPVALTAGVGIRNAALSPDSTKLAYSEGRETANLWRLPMLADRRAGWGDAEQLTFDEAHAEHPDLSPDGAEVAFSTDRRGGPRIWILRLSDGELRPFTAGEHKSWAPRWSPDGREIAFYSYRSGNRDLWIKPVSGGPPRQLTEHPGEDMHPSWSPDGTRIAFMSDRSGNWDVWVVQARGGQPTQITTYPGPESSPEWSSDGEWIVFSSLRFDSPRLWKAPVAGGAVSPLGAEKSAVASQWPAGGKVYFLGRKESAGHIWELTLKGGSVRRVSSLANRRGALWEDLFTARDAQFVFSWKEDSSDLWLMEAALER